MISIVLLVVVGLLVWYCLIKPLHYWSDMGVKQTKPWIFFGDFWITVLQKLSLCDFVERVYNMYPNARYSGLYQFNVPTLMLRDPDLIKQITVKDFEHFTDHRTFVDPESDPLWGNNLFTLTGQKWRDMRSTLSGSFTSSKMKTMYNLIVEAADTFVEHYLNTNEDIIELEMKDAYTRYTNDVIATSAFGIKVDSLAEPKNSFYLMGKEITGFDGIIKSIKFFGFFVVPKLFKFLKIGLFPKEVATFFRNVIDVTIKTREEKKIVRPDMINLLLEARKGIKHEEDEAVETGFATVKESSDNRPGKSKQLRNLTNEDITSQALIFFFAGFDTISTALCFGSHELAINRDIQDRLREEIKETYRKCNGKLTYDVLLKMNYLDMVISEILRKWPPVTAFDRVCTKPYTIEPITSDESPVKLKVGDVIWLPAQGIHRDPAFYPDPEKFDPERFSEENKDNIRPYTYLPFGSGPRNCIGSRFALLEAKALLFKLFLNFEIVPTKKTHIKLVLNKKSFVHGVEGGFWLGLKRVYHHL